MKRPETSLFLSLCHVKKPESGLSPDPDHVGMLILDFPASRTVTNKCMLFKSLNLWYSCDNSPKWLRHWLRALLPYLLLLGLKLQGHPPPAALKLPPDVTGRTFSHILLAKEHHMAHLISRKQVTVTYNHPQQNKPETLGEQAGSHAS